MGDGGRHRRTGGAGERRSPRDVVDGHEGGLDPARRRELGAHYTPGPLALRVVRLAVHSLGHVPQRVCDPSCGAGSFLLAAADHLAASGVAPREVLGSRLVGADIDPGAVAAARAALVQWAEEHGLRDPPEPRVVVADALDGGRSTPASRSAPVDLVVGNPPFLSPLTEVGAQAARPGPGGTGGAYTDASAAHLLAAVDLVSPGGVVAMVQPQSLLGARDAAQVRAALVSRAELLGMWLTDEQPFGASVQVCVPVLRRRDRPTAGAGLSDGGPDRTVAVWWRDGPAQRVALPAAGEAGAVGGAVAGVVAGAEAGAEAGAMAGVAAGTWSPLLAVAQGVPAPAPPVAGARRVGELARCTAGFRDEFYALAEVAVEVAVEAPAAAAGALGGGRRRLVTSGMIDPGHLGWGERSRRLAGRDVLRPAVDLAELERRSPRVARWARERSGPKVLVASQTKVIEAVTDPTGDCLPVTPVISVEPGPGVAPELLAAALSAPSNSAALAMGSAGTGRSSATLRVRAAALAGLEAPAEGCEGAAVAAWRQLVDAAGRRDRPAMVDAGAALDAALGRHDPAVLEWWARRLPRPRGAGAA